MKQGTYPLNGADRFQLYFDSVARKNTGTGNVIRAAVSLEGIIPESKLRLLIEDNEQLSFISALTLKKNLFSTLFRVNPGKSKATFTFHNVQPHDLMNLIASKDCDLGAGIPLHVDVAYGQDRTHIVFSVSHILMDHAGMENLLASFTGEHVQAGFAGKENNKSLSGKLADAVTATKFVSSLTGRSMKRLLRNASPAGASFEILGFSLEDTNHLKDSMTNAWNANALSFFLGATLFSLSKHSHLLKGKNYFVPVPVDRRPASNKNNILSNFISFLYFKATDQDLATMQSSIRLISSQMISQAKKNIPEKFVSLLDIFRFVPEPLYSTFIELPGNGHSATFAFSLLPGSRLEGKKMFGCSIADITHYAPVISPPGLNIIFSEFDGRLKILCSYDERRIGKHDVVALLGTLKSNLLA